MTTARFVRRGGLIAGYEISGHAGYAEAGEDIVCAAVSALAQTTAIGLTEVLGLAPQIRIDEDAGAMSLILSTPEDGAQILLKTLLAGLRAIERQYPRHIRIIDRERRQRT